MVRSLCVRRGVERCGERSREVVIAGCYCRVRYGWDGKIAVVRWLRLLLRDVRIVCVRRGHDSGHIERSDTTRRGGGTVQASGEEDDAMDDAIWQISRSARDAQLIQPPITIAQHSDRRSKATRRILLRAQRGWRPDGRRNERQAVTSSVERREGRRSLLVCSRPIR